MHTHGPCVRKLRGGGKSKHGKLNRKCKTQMLPRHGCGHWAVDRFWSNLGASKGFFFCPLPQLSALPTEQSKCQRGILLVSILAPKSVFGGAARLTR